MYSTHNNIEPFNITCLSEQQIIHFVSGEHLNNSETNDHVKQCELCATAVEGYKKSNLSGAKIKEHNLSLKTELHKKYNINRFNTSYFLGISLLFFSVLAAYFYFQQIPVEPTATNKSIEVINIENSSILHEAFYNETEILEVIIQNKIEKKVPTAQKLLSENQTQSRDQIKLKKLELRPTEISTAVTNSNFPSHSGLRKTLSVMELFQYKIIDYSGEYSRNDFVLIPAMSSTIATYETKNNLQPKVNENGYKKMYSEVLSKAVTLLKEEQYYNSKVYFEYILNTYPDNQNAIFYKAYCDFNLKNYSAAIKSFDLIISSDIKIFTPEANWYKVRCLINSNQIHKAKKLLKEIVAENGFYSERAKNMLVELN